MTFSDLASDGPISALVGYQKEIEYSVYLMSRLIGCNYLVSPERISLHGRYH